MDFDGDGDLDMVRTVPPDRSGYGLSRGSTEWQLVALKAREVQYFEQATWRRGGPNRRGVCTSSALRL